MSFSLSFVILALLSGRNLEASLETAGVAGRPAVPSETAATRACAPFSGPPRRAVQVSEAALAILVRTAVARSRTATATLALYEGPGGNPAPPRLSIRRGDAGYDRTGRKSRASFHARFEATYDASAESIRGESSRLPATARRVTSARLCFAEIVIDDSVRPGSTAEELFLLHELGHAESAARDPRRYLELGADDAENGVACEPLAPSDRPLEEEADAYLRRVVDEEGRDRELFDEWFPVNLDR